MNRGNYKISIGFKVTVVGVCFLWFPIFSLNAQQDTLTKKSAESELRIIPCPRNTPEPILKKEDFPDAHFKLLQSQRPGLSKIGIETAVLNSGDQLKITNSGCEYYTLEFEVITQRFPNKKKENLQLWYVQARGIMTEIADASKMPVFIINGKKALAAYVEKNEQLEDDLNIQFGNSENYYMYVKLNEIKKLKCGHRYKIMISQGPL